MTTEAVTVTPKKDFTKDGISRTTKRWARQNWLTHSTGLHWRRHPTKHVIAKAGKVMQRGRLRHHHVTRFKGHHYLTADLIALCEYGKKPQTITFADGNTGNVTRANLIFTFAEQKPKAQEFDAPTVATAPKTIIRRKKAA